MNVDEVAAAKSYLIGGGPSGYLVVGEGEGGGGGATVYLKLSIFG